MSKQTASVQQSSGFPRGKFLRTLKRERSLWAISAIALVWVAIFAYGPMYGLLYSFFDYRPGLNLWDCQFVGLKYFREFFLLPDFGKILRNTLVISGLNLTLGFIAPIVFALFLNEIHNTKFKRTVQTLSYMPYFVSWVVVASIMNTLLSSNGTINELLMAIGLIDQPISYLNEPSLFWWIQIIASIWKNVGWSAIIYISAISGVDGELYQAGAVDGLGRFGMAWHITIPGILPTIVLLFILGVGNLLNTGYEYQLLVGTPMTRDVYEVIDTYVYRYGIQMGRYPFATAVGLLKSVIGFALVLISNFAARKVTGMSIL